MPAPGPPDRIRPAIFANVSRVNAVRPSRFVVLVALLASWIGSNVCGAAPALATAHRSDGDNPGPEISPLKAVLLFAGIPLGALALIALVVSLPSLMRGPRYRPGRGWQGTPEWYGAPTLEVDSGSGHRNIAWDASYGDEGTGQIVSTGEPERGGSSARW
jgi:hypothetical protein